MSVAGCFRASGSVVLADKACCIITFALGTLQVRWVFIMEEEGWSELLSPAEHLPLQLALRIDAVRQTTSYSFLNRGAVSYVEAF